MSQSFSRGEFGIDPGLEEDTGYEPVAIIGMGCRVPGGPASAAELWSALLEGRDLVGECDRQGRWTRDPWFAEQLAERKASALPAGYIEGIGAFEPGFFGIAAKEAAHIDPQHRLLLEVAWEALEHAGIPPLSLRGSRTGVFVGQTNTEYAARRPEEDRNVYDSTGTMLSGGSGRLSFVLDLNGPSVAIEAGCASSLVSVHLACRALQAGEATAALAGGVHLITDGTTAGMEEAGMLSPTGRCHTFDSRADGFVRSEGCGVVVLKRLADARAAGDRIWAVIHGSSTNHVGRAANLMQPSSAAQRRVLREALGRARTDPRIVGYVEAHGTGTPTGDPIEFAALADVYGDGPGRCALGALKSNTGHAEAAAGVLGLIKATMAVHEGVIPPNLHFKRWNPAIPAEVTRFFVPTVVEPWPSTGTDRAAAVSAFGVTGVNAHIVLKERPAGAGEQGDETSAPMDLPERIGLFPLSAGTRPGLRAAARRLGDWLEGAGSGARLQDVEHTMAVRRSHAVERAAVIASSREELVHGLRALTAGTAANDVVVGQSAEPADAVWVFSGHGSQWPGMGRDLLQAEPAFQRVIAELEPVAFREAGISLKTLIEDGTRVTRMDMVQPLLLAVQLGLAAVWKERGLRPAAVIGHSMGEIAAAVVAGALALEPAMRLICTRSRLLQKVSGGAMAAVMLPQERVEADLAALRPDKVSVAIVSSPHSTVIAGPIDQIASLTRHWQEQEVAVRPIEVVTAAHSPHVDPILPLLRESLSWMTPAQPRIPFYSTVLSDPRAATTLDSRYWMANLREPVHLARAIRSAIDDGHGLFLEVSPHPLLSAAIEETAADAGTQVTIAASLVRDEPEIPELARNLARLYCIDARIDWSGVPGRLTDVPATTWDRALYLTEPSSPVAPVDHAFLGRRTQVLDEESADGIRRVWQVDLGLRAYPWLADHRIGAVPVFPGSGYVEMALAAGSEIYQCPVEEIGLTDVWFRQALVLDDSNEVQTTAVATGDGSFKLAVHSCDTDGAWTTHATARIRRTDVGALSAEPHTRLPEIGHPNGYAKEIYAKLARVGIPYGPAFRGIRAVSTSEDGGAAFAHVILPPETAVPRRNGRVLLHPVLLDCCIQLLAAVHLPDADDGSATTPVFAVTFRDLRLFGDPERIRWSRATAVAVPDRGVLGRIDLLDDAGKPVGVLEGVALSHTTAPQKDTIPLQEFTWTPSPLEDNASTEPSALLIITEDSVNHDAEDGTTKISTMFDGPCVVLERGLEHDDALLISELRQILDDPPADRTWSAVVLCSGPGPLPDPDHARRRVERAVALVGAHSQEPFLPRLYCMTTGATTVLPGEGGDPDQACLRGLVRVAALECPDLRTTLIDLGPGEPATSAIQEICAATAEDEVAWRNGVRYVARCSPATLTGHETAPPRIVPVRFGHDGFRLVATGTRIEDHALIAHPRRSPGRGEVEVELRAVPVNFRDLLQLLGTLPENAHLGLHAGALGVDASGIVTAVGSDVTGLRLGDRVMVNSHAGFGSFTTVPAGWVGMIPDDMSFEEAATIPTPFTTAWLALHTLAGLGRGETVLIHSAASGTGLAALKIALSLGARVFATAGTEEKRSYIRDLGAEQAMDSRTVAFADQIRDLTGGRGVDVVLNSLSGEAMEASIAVLAPFGRFLELGLSTRTGLKLLPPGASYHSVALGSLDPGRGRLAERIIQEVYSQVTTGLITPLPYQAFPLSEATTAFRTMAEGRHIGRILIGIPTDGVVDARVAAGTSSAVSLGASYIITGGLRGVGLQNARWLAGHGAGRIVLNGRSAPEEASQQIIEEMRRAGTSIEVVLGDIADPPTASRLVDAAISAGHPLRGVIHGAVVLDDVPLAGMTPHHLSRTWEPKATGAWHLHTATLPHDLDWWVIHSSMVASWGSGGQGNYAVANAWLDGFASWRSAQGLPTVAINWGVWGEVGVGRRMLDRGFSPIGTDQGIALMENILVHRGSNTVAAEYEAELLYGDHDYARKAPLLTQLNRAGTARDSSLPSDRHLEQIRVAAPGTDRQRLLSQHLCRLTAMALGTTEDSIPAHRKFTEVGIDSLTAVELRNRIRDSLGHLLPINVIWAHPTPARLATHLDTLLQIQATTP